MSLLMVLAYWTTISNARRVTARGESQSDSTSDHLMSIDEDSSDMLKANLTSNLETDWCSISGLKHAQGLQKVWVPMEMPVEDFNRKIVEDLVVAHSLLPDVDLSGDVQKCKGRNAVATISGTIGAKTQYLARLPNKMFQVIDVSEGPSMVAIAASYKPAPTINRQFRVCYEVLKKLAAEAGTFTWKECCGAQAMYHADTDDFLTIRCLGAKEGSSCRMRSTLTKLGAAIGMSKYSGCQAGLHCKQTQQYKNLSSFNKDEGVCVDASWHNVDADEDSWTD